MEVCDNLRKSVLRKPSSPSKLKDKKVTFCGTVKLFIDEPVICKNDDVTAIDKQAKCVEISIVDKSSCEPVCSKIDDCTENDFHVHKVVYDDVSDQDCETETLSEGTEDGSVLFDVSNDEEGLEFVVHKVTEHEDDLIQQELALDCLESNIQGLEISDGVQEKLSELSIENILTHDKIIAFIDQKSLSLASLLREHVKLSEMDPLSLLQNPVKDEVASPTVSSTTADSKLVLSPPLQELGLDKIVEAQSDDILYELEISPLNSIQESDTESDLSSEGTMIMMTSEESEKNELHIRRSFLKYQSLLQEKMKNTLEIVPEKASDDVQNQNVDELAGISGDSSFFSDDSQCEEVPSEGSNAKEIAKSPESLSPDLKACKKFNIINSLLTPVCDVTCDQTAVFKPKIATEGHFDDMKKEPSSVYDSTCMNAFNNSVGLKRKDSLSTIKPVGSWEKSLESVEIPKDVREWKIRTVDKSFEHELPSSHPMPPQHFDYQPHSTNQPASTVDRHSPRSDELESFVHASTERVQRIRKRYLVKPKAKPGISTVVRGIRPRFCTTAEILQMLEEKNQPPFIAFSSRNHVSWPCSAPVVDYPPRDNYSPMFACHILPRDCPLQRSYHSQDGDDSFSSSCDHDSVSSCPSVFFQERGVPEGASPPRSLTNYSIESYESDDGQNNVVYFSMKV